MKNTWKQRTMGLVLSVGLVMSSSAVALPQPEMKDSTPATAVFAEQIAETEFYLQESFDKELIDGTRYAIPSISEWKSGTTAELNYHDGRVWYHQLQNKTAADMVLPLSMGTDGGDPAAQVLPDTDFYVEVDWKAGNTSARLYLMGEKDGKQEQLFYLNQSGSTMRYTNAKSTSSYANGVVSMKQTDSHVIRMLLKRNGGTYTLAKTWIDGIPDAEPNLTSGGSCDGLYCLKTDERMPKSGDGSSFGSLRIWQTAEAQLTQKAAKAGVDFEEIRGTNTDSHAIRENLKLESGKLTSNGLLITGWESTVPEVVATDGKIIRPREDDIQVTLTPIFSMKDGIGDGNPNFQPVNVSAPGTPITVTVTSTRLEDAVNQLTFEKIKGANTSADAVTRDLQLIKEMDGVKIAWTVESITPSGTQATVDPETGAVSRPGKSEQDAKVVLKATLSLNGVSLEKQITFTVKKLDINPEDYLQQAADWLCFSDIAGANADADHITENLNLITSFNGVSLVWTSSRPGTVAHTGKINPPIYPAPSVQVELTAALSYQGAGGVEKRFVVTVLPGVPENLAVSGKVSSNMSGVTAEMLEKLLDESEDTYVEVPARAKTFYLQFDLKEAKPVSRIEYTEISEETAIQKYSVEISDDAINWKKAGEESGVPGKNIISFVPAEVRYLRLNLEKKSGISCLISEAAVRFWPEDKALVEADAEALETDVPGVISAATIQLPQIGKFGSKITWSWAPEELISETSEAGKYHVEHNKSDTKVTLIATLRFGNESAQVRRVHTISGKGGGNIGGGGSASSGSGNSASNPKLPQSTQNPEDKNEIDGFSDLEQAAWAKEYIQALYREKIVEGKGNGMFCPMDSVTREEFVKILILSLDMEPKAGTLERFSDVDAQAWYTPYLLRALQEGLVKGFAEDIFGVGMQITREDMAVMLARALKAEKHRDTVFADQEEIAPYAVDSISALAEMGLLQGDNDGRFRPKASATRAEAAKVLCMLRKAVK